MSDKQSKKQSKRNPADHLKPHQFKPGQSGNPEGRPKKGNAWADIINEMIDSNKIEITIYHKGADGTEKTTVVKTDVKDKTIRHATIYGIIRKAISGDVAAFNALADRTVGRAGQSIDLKIDDFILRIEGVNLKKFPKDDRNKH